MAQIWFDLCDLDLWPLTLTFCMDITFGQGNMSWKFDDDTLTGTCWKRCNRRTDGRTDRQTYERQVHCGIFTCLSLWTYLVSTREHYGANRQFTVGYFNSTLWHCGVCVGTWGHCGVWRTDCLWHRQNTIWGLFPTCLKTPQNAILYRFKMIEVWGRPHNDKKAPQCRLVPLIDPTMYLW